MLFRNHPSRNDRILAELAIAREDRSTIIGLLYSQGQKFMNLQDSLIAAVKAETDVATAAKAALAGYQGQVASLQAQIADLQQKLAAGTIHPGIVQQELKALADSTSDLASAIPAGTSPQPAPAPAPATGDDPNASMHDPSA